ncbi:hypothetical protein [Tenacibaculum caenipelagi]|uniref:Uncharacterized protein n=1 Tax=Tenacibaculum caenipelagi TaxID=1325435 RepID=A0A4R6TE81_9FLAO|nr:hypothetical protein [Tenacibaculum caenipelagi]TDQ21837.1 hypothetical protein DFQ07_2932 [Tenacibaculum caenipelagi]
MVILKKIKASSLNEVIVATIVIVVVFGIAIASLSNIMQNIVNRKEKPLQNKLNEVIYQYHHNIIKIPYRVKEEGFLIYVLNEKNNDFNEIKFEVTFEKTGKMITRKVISYEKD